MTARTYTPEAIEKLVKAATAANNVLVALRDQMQRLGLRETSSAIAETANMTVSALRPFTTEPSSWAAYCRELWGESWTRDPVAARELGMRFVSDDDKESARAAYRARYGVEP